MKCFWTAAADDVSGVTFLERRVVEAWYASENSMYFFLVDVPGQSAEILSLGLGLKHGGSGQAVLIDCQEMGGVFFFHALFSMSTGNCRLRRPLSSSFPIDENKFTT